MEIKSFEMSLEVKLLKRRGKNLELTDVGAALLSYAERIFQIVEEMEHALKGYTDLTHGSLTIGTTRSFARHLMPELFSRFQASFPSVKVYLKEGSSQKIADDLMEFKYDLGIIGRLPHLSKLKVVSYTGEEFCLVTCPQHRFAKKRAISLSELQNEPIIIRESGSRHVILSLLRSKASILQSS
jgi:DNA-binding transcriptional LysR family regulator